jgi:glucose/arabinose dehydrogenase
LILPPGEPPEGGFYGWLWYYIGGHQDPRHAGEHPELREKVFIPDVLLQSHSASLEMTFYTGARSVRTGYKLIRVPLRDGTSSGLYEDFMTGFVTPEGNVWGRPVGVTVTKEGAFLVTDDGANMIWRISYVGR